MNYPSLTLHLVQDPPFCGEPDALGLIPMGHQLSAMNRVSSGGTFPAQIEKCIDSVRPL